MVRSPRSKRLEARPHINPESMADFATELFGSVEHAKRVQSLSRAALGVIHAANLAIHAIGRGMAAVFGLDPKHATKQVDRLIGNSKLAMYRLMECWVRFVVGDRQELVVAMDWTEFAKDSHATLALYLVTRHGRATPLLWRTVTKKTLKNNRNRYEDELLDQLQGCLPKGVDLTILADRGFGDQLRYMYIEEMGWKYVIRFRQDIHITHGGKTQSAKAWLRDKGGRTTKLTGVKVTNDKTEIPCVVLTHAKGMKEAWCLASNRSDLAASQVVKLYGRRFTIEETFRDTKDIHFGMALSATHIKSTARRDRILLLAAMAYALLVLLGAAGERAELDRTLKTNTTKKRTLSLYNQGKYWYSALPNMRDDRRDPLLEAYEQVLLEHQFTREVFGIL